MRALLLIVFCLATSGGSAAAASFDCKKARTKAEKLICATPDLSKADEELARQYKAARRATRDAKALRQAQAAWLRRRRDACADAACMLGVYEQRVAELRATARPGGRTGTYYQDGNSVDILEIAPDVLRFEIAAFWHSGENVNTGELCGEIKVKGNKARYGRKADGCELEWTFGKDGGLTIDQEGNCDFGFNVTATGNYDKSSSDPPALLFCHEHH